MNSITLAVVIPSYLPLSFACSPVPFDDCGKSGGGMRFYFNSLAIFLLYCLGMLVVLVVGTVVVAVVVYSRSSIDGC